MLTTIDICINIFDIEKNINQLIFKFHVHAWQSNKEPQQLRFGCVDLFRVPAHVKEDSQVPAAFLMCLYYYMPVQKQTQE